MDMAQQLFEAMIQHGSQPNLITYNTLINGYCLQGEMEKAKEMFEEMSFLPDIISYNTLVEGYVKVGQIDVALKLLKDMICDGVLPDYITRNTLKKIHAKRLLVVVQ